MSTLPEALIPRLVCPDCGSPLAPAAAGFSCTCGLDYPDARENQPDLRLKRPKTVPLDVVVGEDWPAGPPGGYVPLGMHPTPEVDFTSVAMPKHVSAEILSHLPRAGKAEALALDLGCGKAVHREILEHAGYGYVGVDHDRAKAPMLADAHALPFADDTFELAISIAVLEHIRHPLVMAGEVMRVLAPGGVFIGTLAFLEPFHKMSVYHMTHLGVLNVLHHAGFAIRAIAPGGDYHAMKAMARMHLFRWDMPAFPGMRKKLSDLPVRPVYWLHKLYWRACRRKWPEAASEANRILHGTGDFTFIAVKPEAGDG
jgi:SAM-dependent methyltransferase